MERFAFALPAVLALAVLPDVRAQSESASYSGDSIADAFGNGVGGAGDVDQDGFPDLIVGAPGDDNNGAESGVARIISGKNGAILFQFDGDAAGDTLGHAVVGVGDVDADGSFDVAVGAHNGLSGGGYVRLFSGKDGSPIRTLATGVPFDAYGWAVSEAGDVNNDGFADVIAGAPHEKTGAFEGGLARVSSGKDGTSLFSFHGTGSGYWLGWAVDCLGDVDMDGFADLAVGVPHENLAGANSGAIRIYSGQSGALIRSIAGAGQDHNLGRSVAAVGDIDLDGTPDFVAGEPFASTVVPEGGRARVISGWTGQDVFVVDGNAHAGHLGFAVAGPGDVDGDGVPDVAVGAPNDGGASIFFGRVYVISGQSGVVQDAIGVDTANVSEFGVALAAVDDVDGDGIGDLLAGAPDDTGAQVGSGVARLYHGACLLAMATYGSGGAGTNGETPSLASTGSLPRIGAGGFTLRVDNAVGGAQAALFVGAGSGALHTTWGTFLIDPTLPFTFLPLALGGTPGAAGDGSAIVNATLPNDPLLVGLTAYLQVVIQDAGSIGGFSHTEGLKVTFCR